jgi:hypothetical protein
MPDSVDAVVTLVHGTFARKEWQRLARDERWPKMQAAITKALEPKSVRIDTEFTWTGRNSVNARDQAARKFQEHVQRLDIPDGVPYYVVAHSHGGSVVALALRDEWLRRKVTGLVCLSTPFFHVRARKSQMNSEDFGRGLFAVGVLVAGGLSSLLPTWSGWTIAGMAVGVVLVGIVTARVLSVFSDRALKKMCFPALADVPVLIVRAPADDTSLPLTAFQFVAWLGQWVYWFFDRVAHMIRAVLDGRGKLAVGALALFLAICLVFAVFRSGYGWTSQLLSSEALWQIAEAAGKNAVSAAFAGMVGSSGLALLAYLLAAGVTALTSVLVGPELAIAGLYLDASVETALPGRCDFEQLSWGDAAPSGLQHATHSNPAAISHVAGWLRTAAQKGPRPGL